MYEKIDMYICDCGNEYTERQEIRDHIRECNSISIFENFCDDCAISSMVLLPIKNKKVCPKCAINYHEKYTKLFYNALLLNHMGPKYENILVRKISTLFPLINVADFSELGIDVVLVTFTPQISPISHMVSKNGELILILCNIKELKEREDTAFETVIIHEIMHTYVTNILKLGVTENFQMPRTFVENFVCSAIEDIQVTKISISNNIRPYLLDEIRRDYNYFKNLKAPSTSTFAAMTEQQKFAGMLSLNYSYASELFFSELINTSHTKKHIKRNIRLIKPHIDVFQSHDVVDVILELYRENISISEQEKYNMYNELLIECDNWIDNNSLNLY